ncbi:MAG: ferrous iron transport protein B [bacterium (Candidatus Stahlbacteria) CG23_combo_of_CG06-09_8_20_14_all_34_7]|nr:MAG: ferrous iron transport protein B [bacterium (Candidatus Stahlbacteria) CG23_combo_of_CG06-09_8_20_14_all_34_7]
MDDLLDEAVKLFEGNTEIKRTNVDYGKEIEEELKKIEDIIVKDKNLIQKYSPHWLAVKLLENDNEVIKKMDESTYSSEILSQIKKSSHHLQGIFNDTPDAIIADRRYGFISGACSEALQRTCEVHSTISDKIDKVLVNRILGLPIFLVVMWLIFKFTFKLSEPLMGWIELGQEWLGNLFGGLLPEGSAIQSLIVDGIIGGVGSVLIFVPIIFLLFLVMAFLEDSGYMARTVFIMDKLMHKIGLHGRSFIPMILGFGCNLPAIMATRTIEDKKDRFVTILVNPFMSCGARLPVYTLFIGAFFSQKAAGNVLFSLYLLGIAVAIIMAKIFRKFLFRGQLAPFVMELPSYQLPTIKGLLIHMWERGGVYLKKAGTVIFIGCVLVWFLSNFPWNPQYSMVMQLENEKAFEKMEKSYAGMIGKAISPVFKPLGFDDWKLSVGLLGGFIAKEIVVGTLGTLHFVGEADEESEGLRQSLQNQTRPDGSKFFNPLVAYALMVFVLLYIPCVASIAVIKRETNSWRWPIFAAFYTTAIAWLVAFFIYQGGKLLGFGI